MKKQLQLPTNVLPPSLSDRLFQRIIPFCILITISSLLIAYSFQTKSAVGKYFGSITKDLETANIHRNLKTTNGNTESANQIQERIASEILRFHVIANSDSKEDQALKMKVKDALTEKLKPTLKDAKNVDEARILIKNCLIDLESLSNDIIKENGYTYTASATIEKGYFPLKVYGDLSLPPGEYEAVRIELGSASGQNWWCIMFPPLCFVDTTYNVVPDSSKEQLKYLLTDEEYNALFSKEDTKIKVSFKLFTWLEDFFKN